MGCNNNDLAYLEDINREGLLKLIANPIRETKTKITPLSSTYSVFDTTKPKLKWKCSCGNMNNEQVCLKCGINKKLLMNNGELLINAINQ